MDKIIKTMGLLPEIGKVVVCIEGTNDENFLLNINNGIDELKNIIDLQSKINCGLLAIISMHGSNLKDWINRYALKNTNAIAFHLYDKDDDQKYILNIEKINSRKDGSLGTLTEKREIENYIPKGIIEKEFDIKLNLIPTENWDEVDVPVKVKEIKHALKESDIKSIICGKLSKTITKKDLESLNAWDEVEDWFKKINELVSKVGKNVDND